MIKIIMFGLILAFSLSLVACSSKYKAPTGVRQDLFDDCATIYLKVYNDFTNNKKTGLTSDSMMLELSRKYINEKDVENELVLKSCMLIATKEIYDENPKDFEAPLITMFEDFKKLYLKEDE